MNAIDDKLIYATQCVEQHRYSDATSQFKEIVQYHPATSPDILSFLYKKLQSDYYNQELRIIIAEIYLSEDAHQEAIQELEESFEIDPKFSKTYRILGKIHNKAGFKLKIRQLFESAISQNIFDSAIVDILPKIYIEGKDIDKNIDFFQKLITYHPEQYNNYKILSDLYSRNRDYDNATATLDHLLDVSPSMAGELVAPLQKIVSQAPRNMASRLSLIKAYFHSMKPKEAVEEVKDAVKIQAQYAPKLIELLKKMTQVYPNNQEIILVLSDLLIKYGEYSEAATLLNDLYTHNSACGPELILVLDTILDKFPSQIMALSLLHEIYYGQESIEEALHYLELMITIDPEHALDLENRLDLLLEDHSFFEDKATYLLAKLAFYKEDFDRVKALCLPLASTPYYLESQILLAEMHHILDAPKTSLEILGEARQKEAYHWELHRLSRDMYDALCRQKIESTRTSGTSTPLDMAMLYLSHFDTTRAIETLQGVPMNDDHYFDAQLLLGRAFIEAGRFELALNTLENLCSLSMDSMTNTIKYLISMILCLIGKGTHAIHYLDQILATNVHFNDAVHFREQLQDHISIDLRGLGIGGLSGKSFGHDNFVSFTIDNPENNPKFNKNKNWQTISFAHSHNNDGVTHFLQGNYKAAEQAFRLSLQMDPNLSISYNNLAYLYTCTGHYEKAHNMCNKGLEISPKNSALLLQKGFIYMVSDDLDQALENLEQSFKLSPKNYHTILLIGDCHFRKQQIKAAFDYWKRALEYPPFLTFVSQRVRYLELPKTTLEEWLIPSSKQIPT